MKIQGLTDSALADALRREGVHVSARQVARWRRMGVAMPRPKALAVLTRLSGGQVTANSFVEVP